MTQGSRPRNHLPEKVVMGVRGAAVRHIRVSDSAMLQTNRLMPVWRLGVLQGLSLVKVQRDLALIGLDHHDSAGASSLMP